MIYKFTSKAAGDVIMLGPHGDELMRLLGREPASKGIIETSAMTAALQALEAAVQAEAQVGARAAPAADPADDTRGEDPVSLRRRLWPFIDMMRRCQAAGQPIVWGV